jgi:hypothetical protein
MEDNFDGRIYSFFFSILLFFFFLNLMDRNVGPLNGIKILLTRRIIQCTFLIILYLREVIV